jgi:hypothetical protein
MTSMPKVFNLPKEKKKTVGPLTKLQVNDNLNLFAVQVKAQVRILE